MFQVYGHPHRNAFRCTDHLDVLPRVGFQSFDLRRAFDHTTFSGRIHSALEMEKKYESFTFAYWNVVWNRIIGFYHCFFQVGSKGYHDDDGLITLTPGKKKDKIKKVNLVNYLLSLRKVVF